MEGIKRLAEMLEGQKDKIFNYYCKSFNASNRNE